MNLEKYLIKDEQKINPNVRKLMVKFGEVGEFNALLHKHGISKSFDEIETVELVKAFYLEVKNNNVGKCLTCSEPVKFIGWNAGWAKYCCVSCQMKDPEQTKLRAEDALARFGVSNYLQNKKSRDNAAKVKSTPEYKAKIDTGIKEKWETRKPDIVTKMLETRKINAKPQWASRYSSLLNSLSAQGFKVLESKTNGKPLMLIHEQCGTVQAYGRWANKGRYLCSACNPNPKIKSESLFINNIENECGVLIERNACVGKYKFDGRIGKLLLEFNGLFWHSAAASVAGFGEFDPNYHINKFTAASAAGYKVIQVFEDEWETKSDIIISRIKSALGLNNKIPARKCQFSKIDNAEASIFLKTHHLHGNIPAEFSYGLLHEGKLVAVATFGKFRFSKNDKSSIELYRFCSIGNVVGGLSKIIKNVSLKENKKIITYSDNFWGDGRGYELAGFKLGAQVKPGYCYYDKKNNSRVARQAMTKSNFAKVFGLEWDISLSEAANAERVNCFKMYDAGKTRWVYDNI